MEKVFKVADIRKFEQQVTKGDISYSRMVELMNEMAHTHYVVNKNCNLQNVSVSFDDEIDAELERRRIVQYNDDDDDPHWDEGKLYWARKMFKEGAKWVNAR